MRNYYLFILALLLLPLSSALSINNTIFFSTTTNSTIYVNQSVILDALTVTTESLEIYNLSSVGNFKNINETYLGYVNFYGLNSSIFTNGTGFCNGYTQEKVFDLNINITINPGETCYVYNNYNLFIAYYDLSYNSDQNNGFPVATNTILTSIVHMTTNFFSLAPTIGTILGVCLLIAGIIILVLFIRRLNYRNVEVEDSVIG
jgi:hypothetical protein